MAKTNTTASVELVIAKPTITQIAAMTKAERAAYIAMRTGAQTEEVELDLSRLAKNTADRAIAGLGPLQDIDELLADEIEQRHGALRTDRGRGSDQDHTQPTGNSSFAAGARAIK
mgnify:CR=1 FL=1